MPRREWNKGPVLLEIHLNASSAFYRVRIFPSLAVWPNNLEAEKSKHFCEHGVTLMLYENLYNVRHFILKFSCFEVKCRFLYKRIMALTCHIL